MANSMLEWTGERFVPGNGGAAISYEHVHRYQLAQTIAAGKRVVDLASGKGCGSALLSQLAASAVGVEIDPPPRRTRRASISETTCNTWSETSGGSRCARPNLISWSASRRSNMSNTPKQSWRRRGSSSGRWRARDLHS